MQDGINEAIERNAQSIVAALQAGATYAHAMTYQMCKSTLGPASWKAVIDRVEVLHHQARAPRKVDLNG